MSLPRMIAGTPVLASDRTTGHDHVNTNLRVVELGIRETSHDSYNSIKVLLQFVRNSTNDSGATQEYRADQRVLLVRNVQSNNMCTLLRNSTVKASYSIHLEMERILSIKGRRKHACPIHGMSTRISEASSTCIKLTNANTLPWKKRMQIQLSVANSSPVPRRRNDAVGTVCMQHKVQPSSREYN